MTIITAEAVARNVSTDRLASQAAVSVKRVIVIITEQLVAIISVASWRTTITVAAVAKDALTDRLVSQETVYARKATVPDTELPVVTINVQITIQMPTTAAAVAINAGQDTNALMQNA